MHSPSATYVATAGASRAKGAVPPGPETHGWGAASVGSQAPFRKWAEKWPWFTIENNMVLTILSISRYLGVLY
jgi:hypothetical protein